MTDEDRHCVEVSNTLGDNVSKAMSDERFPRLRSDFTQVIICKTVDGSECLVGGLGPFGVGCMWFKNTDGHMNHYPTFESAPVVVKGSAEERTVWLKSIGLGKKEH